MVKKRFVIEEMPSFSNQNIKLPNSVALLKNGNLVIVDGGSDGVLILSPSGELLNHKTSSGFSKYSFRQPVAVVVSQTQDILIGDWYNHRIVVFNDELSYKGEFGRFGDVNKKNAGKTTCKDLLNRIRLVFSNPPHTLNHFGSEIKRAIYSDSIMEKLKRFLYLSFSRTISLHPVRFNKPNGMAFIGNNLYVSQKNAKCVSKFEWLKDGKFRLLDCLFVPTKNEEFGRLGNLCAVGDDRVYVCDEKNSLIWIVDENLKFIGKLIGEASTEDTFMPFACCSLGANHLIVCGGLNFQILNIEKNEVDYIHPNIGELHGLAYDEEESVLYLCCRDQSQIKRFLVKSDGKSNLH